MTIHLFEQGSDEWKSHHLGKVTSSRIADIMPGDNGYAKQRENYMAELACERLTGVFTETYESYDMRLGKEREPDARVEYELETGNVIYEVGFVDHPTIKNFGVSPDGLNRIKKPTTGIEIKCRKPANHIAEIRDILSGKAINWRAFYQVQSCMFCVGAKKWTYILYNPDVPKWMRLFYHTVNAAPRVIKNIEAELSLIHI